MRILASALLIIASSGCSHNQPNLEARNADKNNKVNPEANFLGDCKIIIRNMANGRFEKDPDSKGGSIVIENGNGISTIFPLRCERRDDTETVEIYLGAKQVNGQWQPAGGLEYGCERRQLADTAKCVTRADLPFYPEDNMQAVSISGNDWHGTGILIDQTTGDEATRQRDFRYCLFHEDVALCGSVFVRRLEPPHHDVYGKVLVVLESIEFID